jgi:hypothetical protein
MYNDHKIYIPLFGVSVCFRGAKTVVEVGVCKADTAVYLAKAAEHNKGIYLVSISGMPTACTSSFGKMGARNGSKPFRG